MSTSVDKKREHKDSLQVPGQSSNGSTPNARGAMSSFDISGAPLQPDGGWGWVVCLTSMLTNATVFGIINVFGILYGAMKEHYAKGDENSSFKTAWVGSVATGMTFVMCMMSSILSDQIGIRTTGMIGGVLAFIGMLSSAFVEELMLLYLTYGVIMGLGFAFAYAPSLVILGHYFKKHMGLVNGLVTFGSSVFTVVMALLLPELLSAIGLRYTLISLSGLCLLLVVNAWTWKPIFTRENTAGPQLAMSAMSIEAIQSRCQGCMSFTKRFLNVGIWKNKGYVIWALANAFSLFGYFVPFVHIVEYVRLVFPESDGKFLLMCLSITSGVARIFLGKMADFKWVNRIRMQQLAFALLGICTLCIPFSESFTGLIIISLIMGICDGAFICLLGPIAFDLVGERSASQALGFLFGMFSLPMSVGPPIAGFLFDHLGNYNIAFHLAGCPPIIGAIILFFVPKTKPQTPAVMTIQEFAAVSCHDIYHSRIEVENLEIVISPADAAIVTPQILTLDDIMTSPPEGAEKNGQAVKDTSGNAADSKDVHRGHGDDDDTCAAAEKDNIVDDRHDENEPMLPKITITEADDNVSFGSHGSGGGGGGGGDDDGGD